MAGEDPDDQDRLSLELPSLGLFRRRQKSSDEPVAEEDGFEREEVTGPLADPRTAPAEDATVPRDRFAPVGEGEARSDHEVTTVSEPVPEPVPDPVLPPVAGEGGYEREEVTGPLADPRTAPAEQSAPGRDAFEPVGAGQPGAATTPEPGHEAEAQRRSPHLPALPPLLAAVLTGVIVGLVLVALTWLVLKGCSGLRGTSTCGNAGFFLVLVVVIAAGYLGVALLRAWRVPDAGSTGFLGVALLTVVALVVSFGDLVGWVGAVGVPLLSAAAYALAQWVTASFTEPGERTR